MASLPGTPLPPASQPHDGVPLELEAGEVLTKGDRGNTQSSSTLAATKVGELQYRLSGRSIELPVELWWKIIDFLAGDIWNTRDGGTQMRKLARVNRAWYTRCRVCAEERLDIMGRDKKGVHRLICRLDKHLGRYSAIKRMRFENKKINTFGSFAVRMAGKLTNVETLVLNIGEWEPGQLHPRIFLYVRAAFESVTALHLAWVSFPSAVVFGRLLCALPRLASLTCSRVKCKRSFVQPPVPRPLRVSTIDLLDSPDVVDFLVETGAGASHHHVTISGLTGRRQGSRVVAVAAQSLSSFHLHTSWYRALDFDDLSLLPDLTPAQNLCVLSVHISPSSFIVQWLKPALLRTPLPNLRELGITVDLSRDSQRRSNFDDFDDNSYIYADRPA
ncbi:uncharacterized protein FIBRA_08719 [Fibroporia radiculosa]|uniref:F-box domain-containing protein n=1 Tax=Fibroporia radiculosa TaxID=599839 RepID=J4GXB1_9APHY|nr:uncharacterized protein FIBRA_08719 [Fibroporia radiculosa]CCM06455.1 predicted protein [Fibroporia radiculosa]